MLGETCSEPQQNMIEWCPSCCSLWLCTFCVTWGFRRCSAGNNKPLHLQIIFVHLNFESLLTIRRITEREASNFQGLSLSLCVSLSVSPLFLSKFCTHVSCKFLWVSFLVNWRQNQGQREQFQNSQVWNTRCELRVIEAVGWLVQMSAGKTAMIRVPEERASWRSRRMCEESGLQLRRCGRCVFITPKRGDWSRAGVETRGLRVNGQLSKALGANCAQSTRRAAAGDEDHKLVCLVGLKIITCSLRKAVVSGSVLTLLLH